MSSGEDRDGWRPPSGSWASSLAVRNKMRANRGRDTKPELALRSALYARGLRYRVDFRPLRSLRRRADIAFTRARVAVFVDGCFWHGCPDHAAIPVTNRDYWLAKVTHNRERDADTDRALSAASWVVVRVWEHEDPQAAASHIAELVQHRRG